MSYIAMVTTFTTTFAALQLLFWQSPQSKSSTHTTSACYILQVSAALLSHITILAYTSHQFPPTGNLRPFYAVPHPYCQSRCKFSKSVKWSTESIIVGSLRWHCDTQKLHVRWLYLAYCSHLCRNFLCLTWPEWSCLSDLTIWLASDFYFIGIFNSIHCQTIAALQLATS